MPDLYAPLDKFNNLVVNLIVLENLVLALVETAPNKDAAIAKFIANGKQLTSDALYEQNLPDHGVHQIEAAQARIEARLKLLASKSP